MLRHALRVVLIALCVWLLPTAGFGQAGRGVSVQPFTNVTGDPGDAWIGDGIAAALRVELQGTPGFEVVTHDQTDARWVLSGAYQRVGSEIRITAQLADASTGAVVRAAKVDGSMEDLFGLQDRPGR